MHSASVNVLTVVSVIVLSLLSVRSASVNVLTVVSVIVLYLLSVRSASSSTAMKTEVHCVGTGCMTIRPQLSLMVAAARADLLALFQMAWHLPNVELDNFL